jgi:hypothetical protein
MDEPGMQPPAGEFSNFDNPDKTMYYYCIVANVLAIPVCTVFVALRVWARYRLGTKIMADDSRFKPLLYIHLLVLISV